MEIKLPRHFSLHHGSTKLQLRAMISIIESILMVSSKRQNQIKEIDTDMRIKDRIQITQGEELKSGISRDQRDIYSKGGRSILKWTQYHCVNKICILQY